MNTIAGELLHTVCQRLLQLPAVFAAPPLRFSLPLSLSAAAVHTRDFQPLSDWLPRACCSVSTSINVASSAEDQHAFLGGFFALAFESLAGARIIVNGAWGVATGGVSDGVGCAFSLLLSAFDDFLGIVAV
jgi:hypothetical protein